MDNIITLLSYILAILIGILPTIFAYSTKMGHVMTFIYDMLNIVSEFMRGNVDHTFTDDEKIALADSIIKLSKDIDSSNAVDAVLNFKYK